VTLNHRRCVGDFFAKQIALETPQYTRLLTDTGQSTTMRQYPFFLTQGVYSWMSFLFTGPD
jgi:hypothetical protein